MGNLLKIANVAFSIWKKYLITIINVYRYVIIDQFHKKHLVNG